MGISGRSQKEYRSKLAVLALAAVFVGGSVFCWVYFFSGTFTSPKLGSFDVKAPFFVRVEHDADLVSPLNEVVSLPATTTVDVATVIAREAKMLYPTKTGGRIWAAQWSNGEKRVLASGQRDAFDTELVARGNGSVSIDGAGVARLQGSAPRMYVYDSAKQKKWNNVEVTVYAKRLAESGTVSSQGIVIGARSDHQDATLKKPCLGATYYGRLLYDGRAVFQKEVIHEGVYSVNKPGENNKAEWNTADGTMPRNVWIGVKFIVKTEPDGKSVHLELYRDLTEGADGGTWEKVAEYTDNGNWAQSDSGVNVLKRCGYPANKVLLDPGTSVFIRNDKVSDVEYKSFSIREIE